MNSASATNSEDGGDAATAQRHRLIDQLKRAGCIASAALEAAFAKVPRHLFLPGHSLDEVYHDEAIVTKRENGVAVSSSSQPAIMAVMLEQLNLQPGQRVLEIGAGTGYNAALMAEIVGQRGQVVTLDIDEDLVQAARAHLAAAGYKHVQAVRRDGAEGYAEAAPYDRIILTVGAWDIAPAWREQLKPEGRLVLPLSLRGPQRSIAFDRAGDHLASASVVDCGFMVLRGALAGPQGTVSLGPTPGITIGVDDRFLVDAERLYAWLTGPFQEQAATVQANQSEVFGGLGLWLALHEPGFCRLGAEGEAAVKSGIVPRLFRFGSKASGSAGVLSERGLCLLTRPHSAVRSEEGPPGEGPRADLGSAFDLGLRSYGDDPALTRRLANLLRAWDAAGRPGSDGLRIRAYPSSATINATPGVVSVRKPLSTLVLDWPEKA